MIRFLIPGHVSCPLYVVMRMRSLGWGFVVGVMAAGNGCGGVDGAPGALGSPPDRPALLPPESPRAVAPTSPSTSAPSLPDAAPTSSNEQLPSPSLEPPAIEGSSDAAPETSGEDTTPVPAPPATCERVSTLAAGDRDFTLEFDGAARTYLVHVPPNLDPAQAVPLVVDLHGLTSTAAAQARISGWREKADEAGFIVAHPQGLGKSWNGGDLCCGSSRSGDVDDEGFIRAMVAQIEATGCIDPKRVYATGLSNGGALSHLLACNAADLFAASAPVSMGNGTRPCQPSRPISVVMTRGTEDALVNFNGGTFPSAQADFEQWAALDGCQGQPERVNELCQAFTKCDGGVEVQLCALAAGHVLYDNRQNFSVPDAVWATFERQTLP